MPPLPICQIGVEHVDINFWDAFQRLPRHITSELNQHLQDCTNPLNLKTNIDLSDLTAVTRQTLSSTLKKLIIEKSKLGDLVPGEGEMRHPEDMIDSLIIDMIQRVVRAYKAAATAYKLKPWEKYETALNKIDQELMPQIKENEKKEKKQLEEQRKAEMATRDKALAETQQRVNYYSARGYTVSYDHNHFNNWRNAINEAAEKASSGLDAQKKKRANDLKTAKTELQASYKHALDNKKTIEEQLFSGFNSKSLIRPFSCRVPTLGVELKLVNKIFSSEDGYRRYRIVGGCGMALHKINVQPIHNSARWLRISEQAATQENRETFKPVSVEEEKKWVARLPIISYVGQDEEYRWLLDTLTTQNDPSGNIKTLHNHVLTDDIPIANEFSGLLQRSPDPVTYYL